ncbi:hypothetical protein [Thalassobaculum sp.]|uniref:hypothetical protein n=1 Tax=Thalassobaculum sp. TaxID=2022740 RepID=UPI0032EC4F7B
MPSTEADDRVLLGETMARPCSSIVKAYIDSDGGGSFESWWTGQAIKLNEGGVSAGSAGVVMHA